jgi:serine/threonine-protein kinase RsbW
LKIDVALCLPRDAPTVAVARRVISAALGELGVTGECLEEIRIALSEACTNVIVHSASDDEYEIRLEVDDDLCQIRVVDKGRGLDTSALSSRIPLPEATGGRGVALMHALMDTAHFESEPEQGTVVHLTKTLELEAEGALRRLLSSPAGDL